MHKMFMNKQDWDDIVKWGAEVDYARDYPHVIVPLYGEAEVLFIPPADLDPSIARPPSTEIIEPPGLVRLDVLRPVWEWRGHPPVLHMDAMGWREFEDLQIAFELERQITGKIDVQWGEPLLVKNDHLNIFETDYAYLEKKVLAGLGVPKSLLGLAVPEPPGDADPVLDREIFADIDIKVSEINTPSRRLF